MKKINSILTAIVLNPVYAAGFVYEIGKHVVNKFRQQESESNDNPAVGVVREIIADVAHHYNNENTDPQLQESVDRARELSVPEENIIHNNDELDAVLNNGRGRTIYDNPDNVNILSGKEDTL